MDNIKCLKCTELIKLNIVVDESAPQYTIMEAEDSAFDKVMEIVGNDGKFQKHFNFIFNCLFCISAAMVYMNIILALSEPGHWCHVPGREFTNFSVDEWKRLTLPNETNNRGEVSTSSCKMYNISRTVWQDYDAINLTNVPVSSCLHGHDYDKTWYEETVISQEDWVCDRELYTSHSFMFNRIGEVVGTFIVGQLGDTLGRRWVFYMSVITVMGGKLITTITSSNFLLFIIASIVGSFTAMSVFTSPLIIGMEISKGDDRGHIAMLQCIGWTIGMCVLPLVFWIVRDWTWFIIITSLPTLFILPFHKYIIESPRWLANKGHLSKCVIQLQKIADINGKSVKVTEKMLTDLLPKAKAESLYGMMSLFSGWRLAKNTCLIVLGWTVCAMTYFTLTINASRMDGNPFLNFLYQSAIEMPGYIFGRIIGDRYGRRFTFVSAFTFAAIGFTAQIFIVPHTELALLGSIVAVFVKFWVSITFYVINLQAMETYPTCLRQTGISIGAIFANALGVFGPYIVYLGVTYDIRYPYMIMGVLCLMAAVGGFFLPETLHQKLPETLAEAHLFGADQSYWSLPKAPKKHDDDSEVTEKLKPQENTP